MSEPKPHDVAEIEGLLGSRRQLMGWLERLDSAASRAPESVRAKVRADYRARLAQVVTQLSSHSDVIASSLEGLRAQARELRQTRGEELEIRAEAELRHAVGEYSDDEWQLVELESSGKITEFDHELERLTGEIQRLEEVHALITPAAHPTPDQVRHPEVHVTRDYPPMDAESVNLSEQPALSLVRDEGPAPTPQPRPEAPRFVPRGGAPKARESGPARSIPLPQSPPTPTPHQGSSAPAPVDELAFLRSVTLDTAPPSARLTPNQTPTPAGAFDREERPSQLVAKTLKCSECGSLNRPTEWYCERCGAELAAL